MTNSARRTAQFRVGVFNIEHFGVDPNTGHHDGLNAAIDFLLQTTPVPPEVLILPECTRFEDKGFAPLRGVINTLSRALPRGQVYEAFVDDWGDRRNPPGILFNRSVFDVTNYFRPNKSASPYKGVVKATIQGIEVVFLPDHWPGGSGREEFDRSAQRWKPWSDGNAIGGGDLNITSSWEKDFRFDDPGGPSWYEVCERRGELRKLEQKGWQNPATGEWEIDTRALDKLRDLGWRDAGEEAGDASITDAHPADGLGLRIDRILRSPGFHGGQVEGSYFCRQPPREISDHAYVGAEYVVHAPAERNSR